MINIDRDYHSKEVIERLIELSHKINCIFLKGNHEDMLYNERSRTKLDLRMFQSAVEDFNKAIELNPNDANYYIGRGQALLECAGEDFHKALNMASRQTKKRFSLQA